MPEHNHPKPSNIKYAFILNLLFTMLEIVGGLWTNSMAILADAVHDLGDSLALGIAWFLEVKSAKKGTNKFSFGYHRFSLLGALINGFILIGGAAVILINTIPRLIHPEPANAKGMLLFALIGIAVNGYAAFKLTKGKTMNERMIKWHLLEDVLGWVAVLIVGAVLMVYDLPILDPLLSLLILAYVLYNVFRNLKQTISLFLQGVPENVDLNELKMDIEALDYVDSVHHIHIWSLDGERHVLSVHVVLKDITSIAGLIKVKRSIRSILKSVPVEHATIEMEFSDEECYMEDSDVS